MNAVWSIALPLVLARAADPVPDPADVKPGWIGLITVAALAAASLFLWFSLRKQLKRIQVPREDEGADEPGGLEAEGETERHDQGR